MDKQFKLCCNLSPMSYNGLISYHITASFYDGFCVRLVSLEQGRYLVQGKESKKAIASYLLSKCYLENKTQLPPIEKDSCYYTDSLGRYRPC